MRHRIPKSDREIAGKLLMQLANHPHPCHDEFCLSWCYEYDTDFLLALAKDIGLPGGFPGESYLNRLRKICRHLQTCGILAGRIRSCHAEYIGEPRSLKTYEFADPAYAWRLAPQKHTHYKPMGKPEWELDFLLERAYPEER